MHRARAFLLSQPPSSPSPSTRAKARRETNDALREAAARALTLLPSARLACVNVLKQSYIGTRDTALDEEGHNKHVNRLVALKAWAQPLRLGEGRITYHVLEAIEPASAILTYAEQNRVDQILIGARQHSLWSAILGSVSIRVASEASCTVTVVRPPRKEGLERGEPIQGGAALLKKPNLRRACYKSASGKV